MRKEAKTLFSPDEIREMERADRAISKGFQMTVGEYVAAGEMDVEAVDSRKDHAQAHLSDMRRKWRQGHKESEAERNKLWRENNTDHLKEYKARYNTAHRDEIKDYNHAYYAEHKDEIVEYTKAYQAEHVEEHKRDQAKYRKSEKGRASGRRSSATYYRKHRDEILKRQKERRNAIRECESTG